MRASLFYNPADAITRAAIAIERLRRRRILRGTPAERLSLGHLDSLELLLQLRDRPPGVIYDVGANVGTWTCLAKSLNPNARVEAFEPLHEHAAGFREWTAPWGGTVTLHHVALGPRDGTAELHVTSFSDASSLLPLAAEGRKEFQIDESRRVPVPLVRLDTLLAEGRVPAPDLIKLDVQGYELEVLRGAERCLAQARAVICEVSFRRFYEQQAIFADVLTFLAERGLALHAFGANLPLGQPLAQTDALFLRTA